MRVLGLRILACGVSVVLRERYLGIEALRFRGYLKAWGFRFRASGIQSELAFRVPRACDTERHKVLLGHGPCSGFRAFARLRRLLGCTA